MAEAGARKKPSGGGQRLLYTRVGDEPLWTALARYSELSGTSMSAVVAEALVAFPPLKAFMALEARQADELPGPAIRHP